jgi:hypothetical protein
MRYGSKSQQLGGTCGSDALVATPNTAIATKASLPLSLQAE